MVFTLTGPSGVGKSTLASALGGRYGRECEPTVAPEFVGTTYETTSTTFKVNVWSTPGSRTLAYLASPFMTNATTIVFVYDASNPATLREVKDFHIPHFLDDAPADALVVLLGNKKDLLPRGNTLADQPRRKALLDGIKAALSQKTVVCLDSCALDPEDVKSLTAGLVDATLAAHGIDGLPIARDIFEIGSDGAGDGGASRCCTIS